MLSIAVAFSGGPDSLAALYLLGQHLQSIGHSGSLISLTVNHSLQPASDAMTSRCRELSESIGVRNLSLSIPWSTPPFPQRPIEGQAFEEIARGARYQLIFDAMRDEGCSVLITGHHADDNVETVLMRMLAHPNKATTDLHNAGIRRVRRWGMGLSNIPNSLGWAGAEGMNKWIIRPLLDIPKASLVETCKFAGLKYVLDATNEDPSATSRNALRAVLDSRDIREQVSNVDVVAIEETVQKAKQAAGEMESLLAPPTDIRPSLRRWAEVLGCERERIDKEVSRLLRQYTSPSPPSTVLLRMDQMRSMERQIPGAIKRAIVLRILRYVSPKPWGHPSAEAGRRAAVTDRIVNELFTPSTSSRINRTKLNAGADVVWKLIKDPIFPGGLVWVAYRSPPRRMDKLPISIDITSDVRKMVDTGFTSGGCVSFLWDCRFIVKLLLAKMPPNVMQAIRNDAKLTIEPYGPWVLPKVVVATTGGEQIDLGVDGCQKLNTHGVEEDRAWIFIHGIRKLSCL